MSPYERQLLSLIEVWRASWGCWTSPWLARVAFHHVLLEQGPFPPCPVKSWRACRVLSPQEKSLTDAPGKGASGVLQEAMS